MVYLGGQERQITCQVREQGGIAGERMSGSVFDASGWPMSRGSGVVSRDNKSGKAGIVPVEAVVVTPELPATPVPRREIEDSTDAGGTRPLRQLLRSRILQVGKPIDHVQWLGPHTHICMAGYTKLLTIQDAMGYPFPVAWGGPLILDYMSVHTLGLWLSYYYGRSLHALSCSLYPS